MQELNIIPFKAGDGISHTLTQRLLEKGRTYGLNAIFPFSIDKIKVAEWVHLKCRYGCNQYKERRYTELGRERRPDNDSRKESSAYADTEECHRARPDFAAGRVGDQRR